MTGTHPSEPSEQDTSSRRARLSARRSRRTRLVAVAVVIVIAAAAAAAAYAVNANDDEAHAANSADPSPSTFGANGTLVPAAALKATPVARRRPRAPAQPLDRRRLTGGLVRTCARRPGRCDGHREDADRLQDVERAVEQRHPQLEPEGDRSDGFGRPRRRRVHRRDQRHAGRQQRRRERRRRPRLGSRVPTQGRPHDGPARRHEPSQRVLARTADTGDAQLGPRCGGDG